MGAWLIKQIREPWARAGGGLADRVFQAAVGCGVEDDTMEERLQSTRFGRSPDLLSVSRCPKVTQGTVDPWIVQEPSFPR